MEAISRAIRHDIPTASIDNPFVRAVGPEPRSDPRSTETQCVFILLAPLPALGGQSQRLKMFHTDGNGARAKLTRWRRGEPTGNLVVSPAKCRIGETHLAPPNLTSPPPFPITSSSSRGASAPFFALLLGPLRPTKFLSLRPACGDCVLLEAISTGGRSALHPLSLAKTFLIQ